jgi:hypothetical protein
MSRSSQIFPEFANPQFPNETFDGTRRISAVNFQQPTVVPTNKQTTTTLHSLLRRPWNSVYIVSQSFIHKRFHDEDEIESEFEPKGCCVMISPTNPHRVVWDMLMVIILLFVFLTFPLVIAFGNHFIEHVEMVKW